MTLFRATKKSVVICKAIMLYEMSYLFRSTQFETTDFQNCFRPNWNVHPDRAAVFSTCLVNDDMEQTYKPLAFLIADRTDTCVSIDPLNRFFHLGKNRN